MYTILNPLLIKEELIKRRLFFFTANNFEQIFQLSKSKSKYFLEKNSYNGLFIRLKKGLYCINSELVTEEELANRLYQPSYISFEYALAYYNIIPEMIYSITSATTKPTRTFTVNNKTYSYLTIKEEAYTGYSLIKKGGTSFYIAEPEKALIDYLYFTALGKKTLNDRINTAFLQKKKLVKYANLFNRVKLLNIVEKL